MAAPLPEVQAADSPPLDPQRLAQLKAGLMRLRWLVTGLLWLVLLPLIAWILRAEISLMADYFTWVALRYAIAHNFWAAIALSICLGMTIGTLFRQGRTLLFGLTAKEQYRLEQLLQEIDRQGRKHPLWRWLDLKSS